MTMGDNRIHMLQDGAKSFADDNGASYGTHDIKAQEVVRFGFVRCPALPLPLPCPDCCPALLP